MMLPYFFFQSQVRLTNSSRPSSWRPLPGALRRWRSTISWVAIRWAPMAWNNLHAVVADSRVFHADEHGVPQMVRR